MIRLYGLIPERDIKISYSGIRSGEKLDEELTCRDEELVTTDFPSIFMAQKNGKVNRDEMLNLLFNIEKEITLYDYENLFKDLKKVLPSFDQNKMWYRQ
ncbi:MAG: polysaccharide biosynthesis protein [Actinomycetota bacterium]|nr:polysaccharide biosynthesis protein [Actinomycetota bacterium]